MILYNENSIPDDPSRTADYGHFDWENEADAQEISEENAVRFVNQVLEGKEKRAFGLDDASWEEDLCSDYLVNKYRSLAIALLRNDQATLTLIGNYLRECVHNHANDWLAEADTDELESEGFWP